MSNYQKVSVSNEARTELHDLINLTGAEVSINKMPASAQVPFVHRHKQNEEIYGIMDGPGYITLDGEVVELNAGDWLRVAPQVKRQMSAAPDSSMSYICIQVREGSLQQWTMTDGEVL